MPAPHSASPAFSGLWIPIVTPFRDGLVDHDALAALTRHLTPTGVAGFVVCGSTGEAAALDDLERLACLATVAAHARGLPLMYGMSGENLRHARAAVREVSAFACASIPTLRGLLVSAPQYVRPSQDGVRSWFETLADDSAVPLVVYDIPYRTGTPILRDTLLTLAAHPNIAAVKDCGGDLGKTLAVLADGRLAVLAGEDLQLFSHLALGAAGAISASAHLHTARFVQLMRAIEGGRLAEARAAWAGLVPMIELLFSEPNPAAVKTALAETGWIANELRAPMQRASDGLRQRLASLLPDQRPSPSQEHRARRRSTAQPQHRVQQRTP